MGKVIDSQVFSGTCADSIRSRPVENMSNNEIVPQRDRTTT